MLVQPRSILIAALGLVMACGKKDASPSLTNEALKDLLERDWNAGFPARLGRIEFIATPKTIAPNSVPAAFIPVYRALQEKGYVTLGAAAGSASDWESVARTAGSGASAPATVAVTEAGKRAASEAGSDSVEIRRFPVGDYRIEKIISNDTIAGGPQRFRLVQGTHTAVIDTVFKASLAKLDGTDARERRFRALLLFDPQALHWTVVALDLTDRTQDFATQRVPEALKVVAQQAKAGS